MLTEVGSEARQYVRSSAKEVAEVLEAQTNPGRTFIANQNYGKRIKERVAMVTWHFCISMDGERFWVQHEVYGKLRWYVLGLDDLSDAHVDTFARHFRQILANQSATEPVA